MEFVFIVAIFSVFAVFYHFIYIFANQICFRHALRQPVTQLLQLLHVAN